MTSSVSYARVHGSGDKLVEAKACPRCTPRGEDRGEGLRGEGLIETRTGELKTCPRCKGAQMVRA